MNLVMEDETDEIAALVIGKCGVKNFLACLAKIGGSTTIVK